MPPVDEDYPIAWKEIVIDLDLVVLHSLEGQIRKSFSCVQQGSFCSGHTSLLGKLLFVEL
jgi:hypothetical protein